MRRAGLVSLALSVVVAAQLVAQSAPPPGQTGPPAGQASSAPTAPEVQAAIDKLGSFDFPIRTEAARVVRRAPAEIAVRLLAAAARAHADEYVRYRALTLLAGFGGPVAATVMGEVKTDINDRLRTVAFAWFEHNPDPAVIPALLDSLKRETSEFVRPALMRAIAAHQADPRAREVLAPMVLRGEDFCRGSVIEALGEYGGTFALPDILQVAQLDGPLQDDAITAVGRIGDQSKVNALVALQRSARPELQPTIAASLCLLDRECAKTEDYLKQTIAFAAGNEGYQKLLRGAVHGLAMLTLRGKADSWKVLVDAGVAATSDASRSPIALGVGIVALRKPELVLNAFELRADLDAATELLRDAFDMLEEDFEEERFYVAVRQAYWAAPAGSARRRTAEALIQKLEF
jgi:HEAT repeat protein